MSLSWVNGTVEAVLADLRKTYATSPTGDTGMVYAAAVGMIMGLTGPHDSRSAEARMADAATVCAAIRQFEVEEPGR